MDFNEYQEEVQNIKDFANENDISEDEVNKIFAQCFQLLEEKTQTRVTIALKFLKIFGVVLSIGVLCTLVLYNHPKTHNVLLRNVQNFIYPGLKIFRKIAVPVVNVYPLLSGTKSLLSNTEFFK